MPCKCYWLHSGLLIRQVMGSNPWRGTMNTSLQEQINAVGPWFQSFPLPDGCRTCVGPHYHDPSLLWSTINPWIPNANPDCYKALDVGCNGGFFTRQLCRKGYKVDAIDVEQTYLNQTTLIKEIYHLDCDVFEADITEYYPDRQYDIVLCLGVVYHLVDIVRGIQNCLDMAKHYVIFESATSKLDGSVVEFFNYSDDYKWVSLPTLKALNRIIKCCGGEVDACVSYEDRVVIKATPRVWKQQPFKDSVASLGDNVELKRPENFVKVVV